MKQLLKNSLLLILYLILQSSYVFCKDMKFNKVIPDDGTNFSSVTGITQDKNGFIWFSTKKGLYRYDGIQLTSFVNDRSNSNSLASNLLLCIYADTNGDIWVGSLGNGLDRYNPDTGIFTHFMHNSNDPGSILNDTVNAILKDKEGKLWIATQQGLDQFDPKTNKFIHSRSVRNDPTTISDRQVRILYEDREGTLWIGTGSPFPQNGGGPNDGGLDRYNRKTNTFTRYEHIPGNEQSLISNKISALFEDNNGVFWVGTAKNGLHQMNREDGTFKRILYDPAHPEKFSIPPYKNEDPVHLDFIHFIIQDITGRYWVGTKRSGLFYFDPEVGKMVHFQEGINAKSGFTDRSARSAFTSHHGILWIGSDQGNLYRLNLLSREILHISVSTAPVTRFYEEPDGTFWLGTKYNLIRIDKKNGETKSFNAEFNFSNDGTDLIYDITNDHQGNLWISGTSGLYLWNSDNHTFTGYQHDPKNGSSISDTRVVTLFEDSKNNVWVATFNGLNLMDRKTGTFTHFWVNKADTISSNQNLITSILEDKTGKLWIGSWNKGGINLFDREAKTFKNYLKGSSVTCIYEDSNGILWVGANDGLYKYNPDIDNFILYTDFSVLNGSTDVLGIIEDNQKNLWIGTIYGIIKLNPQRNETSLFGPKFGVENLYRFSAYKGRNGDIYFGNNTGYYKINPADFLKDLPSPKIVITGFRLSNQLIRTGKNGPLKKNLQETREIKLDYNQNVFSFDYAIIDYFNPEENRLFYYLENYDKDWSQANATRRAYYFNIPPGKYVFHVKGSNSDGVWAEKKIDLLILPPWYQTRWAYGVYVLLFIAGVFAFDRFQRKRIIKRERLRTQERELAQAHEIEKAYKELKATQSQLIHSEKMASLGELTAGIAHEIKNPLNFVNNFSDISRELLNEMKTELQNKNEKEVGELIEDLNQNLEKINEHGKRADSIVKGMLLHSRGTSGEKALTDINDLLDQYVNLAYHGMRAQNKEFNITIEKDYDETLEKISVVPQDISRVFLNIINNACYAAYEKKKKSGDNNFSPRLNISTKNLKDKIEIRIGDNGNGIPTDILDKIFQPFFTTKPTGEGTGLGLSLSYDIVTKVHGGELRVETKEGEGTIFKIFLPK